MSVPPDRAAERRRDAAVDGRDETLDERADRNWNELLQELRVLQTGTQIITGFLLALAFQPAFRDLSDAQRGFYLALIIMSVLSAIVALASVALHRGLFRRRVKPLIVRFGHVALVTALVTVSLLLVGVVAFVFDVVLGGTASWIVGASLTFVIVVLWVVAPGIFRRLDREELR